MNSEFWPLTPVYGRPEFSAPAPKTKIPDGPMAPDSAYNLITDELLLDGRAGLNLATFCNEASTDLWGQKLIVENLNKNFIDHEEYPATNLAEKRAIWMLAKELGTTFDEHDTDPDTACGLYGAATIGSSEAVMLGLIAHKYRWIKNNEKNLRQGRADPQDRPVVLMSAHVHGCWDKFCRYYGAVPLYIKIDGPPYSISGSEVLSVLSTEIEDPVSPYADEIRKTLGYLNPQGDRTIGELVMCVGAVVGSTFTGNCDNVVEINGAVDQFCREAPSELNLDIPIHVDAASAGFVLLFSDNGSKIPFDFGAAERVRSINVSNHKFGMTFPGMGSVIFRDRTIVDDSLVYHITYLGGNFTDYTVNFSRGASMILMQYYNLLRFGRAGYQEIMRNCLANTAHFIDGIRESPILGPLLTDISDWKHLPIVILTWNEAAALPNWNLTHLSHALRQRGWIVPSYVLPRNSPDEIIKPDLGTQVLRVVVQQAVSRDKLSLLVRDMEEAVTQLSKPGAPVGELPPVTGYMC